MCNLPAQKPLNNWQLQWYFFFPAVVNVQVVWNIRILVQNFTWISLNFNSPPLKLSARIKIQKLWILPFWFWFFFFFQILQYRHLGSLSLELKYCVFNLVLVKYIGSMNGWNKNRSNSCIYSKHLSPYRLNKGRGCLEKTTFYHIIKDIFRL